MAGGKVAGLSLGRGHSNWGGMRVSGSCGTPRVSYRRCKNEKGEREREESAEEVAVRSGQVRSGQSNCNECTGHIRIYCKKCRIII